MYKQRTLENYIKKVTNQFPVLLVTGARQVGKTTLLKYLSDENRKYITLDDPIILRLAREDPALFMQRFSSPLLIDEIQYAPELLPYLKMAVDEDRKAGMFWLTGSQQFQMMKGVSESLAGRVGIINLLGFSRTETTGINLSVGPFLPTAKLLQSRFESNSSLSLQELFRIIWRGFFPEISISTTMDRDLFYSSYLQTYLQRDIRSLAKVGDEMAFMRFIRAAAARTGQILNMADLARDADISFNTAKNWLSILQRSGLVFLLESYSTNLTKRLVKTPKLYFLDTGLCSYLTEWTSPETLEAGAMSGHILETWIFSEILKSYWHNGLRAPFYYYRDKDKKEIDLIIIKDGVIYPLEFKKTASPNKHMVKHFRLLEKLNKPIGSGGVLCLAKQILPLSENAFTIPVSVL